MAEKPEIEMPIAKLALDKKLIDKDQLERCLELVKKSRKIGLQTTIEEVLVKQGLLTETKVEELQEINQMVDGGKVFGTYRLGRLIGQGGMGKVYEAVHEIMGRSVAIKVINAKFTEDKNNTARFYQEIRALAKLSHPNIVIIFEAGMVNRRHYFAMEYLSGPSFRDRVDAQKALDEKEALKIIRATAKALGHAHTRSIIHRDVKPENIIFDENGVPKLTDFGLVMHYDADHMTLTQEGMMVGSFYYTSPEQIDGRRDIDARSDIYSLGATLYYALTGHTLYEGNSPQEILTKHLKGRYLSPKHYNSRISGKCVRLLKKMIAVNREKRFQSMEAVVDAIDGNSLAHKSVLIGAMACLGSLLLLLGMLLERFFHIFK
jgi:eukaryotic-like serine/threonine-protein kinase